MLIATEAGAEAAGAAVLPALAEEAAEASTNSGGVVCHTGREMSW